MAKQQAGSRPPPQQGRGQIGQEPWRASNLRPPAQYGYNERTREIVGKLEEALKHPETPLDVRLIQSLKEEIQRANREMAAQGAQKADESQKTYIDPSRLPPAYRKSIEKYFQKLSRAAMRHLGFEYPLAWLVGLPLAAAAVGLMMWSLRRQGQPWRRAGMLAALRAVAIFVLVALAARPALVDSDEESLKRNEVVLLLDRSESMSLGTMYSWSAANSRGLTRRWN